jgi:hypothetical protein
VTIDGQMGFTNIAGSRVAIANTNQVEWFDLTTRKSLGFAAASDAFFDSIWNWAIADDGTAYGIGFYIDGVSGRDGALRLPDRRGLREGRNGRAESVAARRASSM